MLKAGEKKKYYYIRGLYANKVLNSKVFLCIKDEWGNGSGCILQATRAATVNMKSVYGGQYVS